MEDYSKTHDSCILDVKFCQLQSSSDKSSWKMNQQQQVLSSFFEIILVILLNQV